MVSRPVVVGAMEDNGRKLTMWDREEDVEMEMVVVDNETAVHSTTVVASVGQGMLCRATTA